MEVRFYANMRTIIGKTSLEIDDARLDSFHRLLDFLVDSYPDAAFHLLDEHGNLRQDVPVYVDGRNPRLMKDGVDAPLQPDSVVSFFSPIASGRMNVEVLRKPAFGKRSDP